MEVTINLTKKQIAVIKHCHEEPFCVGCSRVDVDGECFDDIEENIYKAIVKAEKLEKQAGEVTK